MGSSLVPPDVSPHLPLISCHQTPHGSVSRVLHVRSVWWRVRSFWLRGTLCVKCTCSAVERACVECAFACATGHLFGVDAHGVRCLGHAHSQTQCADLYRNTLYGPQGPQPLRYTPSCAVVCSRISRTVPRSSLAHISRVPCAHISNTSCAHLAQSFGSLPSRKCTGRASQSPRCTVSRSARE